MKSHYRIFFCAGEASSDLFLSKVLRNLKKSAFNIQPTGIGGNQSRDAGLETLVRADELSLVGVSEWIDQLPNVYSKYRKIRSHISETPYDLAVLCDLPDFNLKLAKHFSKKGTPIVYFISPQVWAWRKYRLHAIKKHISKMLVIFPFEKDFYTSHGMPTEYVGHPLTEILEARTHLRKVSEISPHPRIAILPGSRKSEIRHHSLIVKQVITSIEKNILNAEIKIPVADTLSRQFVESAIGGKYLTQEPSHDVLKWADAALVASGTATLETALIGTPFCLFYRMTPITEWGIRNIVRYRKLFGMPNLILKREAFKEFLFNAANPYNVFEEIKKLLSDDAYRSEKWKASQECRQILGTSDTSQRVSDEILELLQNAQ